MPVCIQANEQDTMAYLQTQLPCRSQQIQTLLSLFGKPSQPACPSMFIYGHTCTGKSLVVSTILSSLKIPHVIVNCVECYTQRLIYEHILTTLFPDSDLPKTDNMNEFIRHLKQNIQGTDMAKEALYIVLDKAERLRDMYVNLLPAFLRLQELTGANICTIFLSEIVWEKFRFGTGFAEPIIVHFPDYSKDELIEIMSLDCPCEDQGDLYRSYVSLVLDVFYLACRELRELRHLALLNFPKYIEPIEKEEATAESTKKLWRNIEPHLKKALQTVYLREISSTQWERLQQSEEGEAANVQALSSRTHIELPYYTKFLLIASYLASYNPAKTDKRFFAKNSGKTSRRDKLMKKHERTTNQMLGPKPFPLDRLMAIFYSIVEERVAPTANIFMQISSLVTLHLVSAVVGDDQLDSPKYKCLVSLDFIKAVSRTVSFDIVRYLYDFI